MINDFNELFLILFQTTIIFIVLYFIYKKQIFSLFDPLLFYILTQSFSILLAILEIKDFGYLISFLLYQIFFALGFSCLAINIRKDYTIDDSNLSFSSNELKFWTFFTVFGFILVVLANIYLISVKGVILFLDDPTKSKVAVFEDGGGIGAVRRINWGLLKILNLSLVFIYLKTKKRIFLFMLIVLLLITVSGGAKSSLLVYVTILAILGQFKSIKKTTVFKKIDKVKIPLVLTGLALSIFIIGANSKGLGDSVLGLGVRFLFFGDILFYYYNDDAVKYFQQLGFLDFLKYELNSFSGILRITPYLPPLSFELVQYSFNHNEVLEVVTGPNLPYYVKGHIFFGKYGALLYSFTVGFFIAYIRNLLFKKHSTYSQYILIIFLNLTVFSFAQDSALELSVLFDTFLFAMVPIFLSFLLMYPMKKLKHDKNF
jgi:oligosaccharide repeat unit polymerase